MTKSRGKNGFDLTVAKVFGLSDGPSYSTARGYFEVSIRSKVADATAGCKTELSLRFGHVCGSEEGHVEVSFKVSEYLMYAYTRNEYVFASLTWSSMTEFSPRVSASTHIFRNRMTDEPALAVSAFPFLRECVRDTRLMWFVNKVPTEESWPKRKP